jgi:hypothetical protein
MDLKISSAEFRMEPVYVAMEIHLQQIVNEFTFYLKISQSDEQASNKYYFLI